MSDEPHGRGRPTADQSAQIAERILDAAWQLLLAEGPERFTLDRIAPLAHASKQTIYTRFSGKLDLLQKLLTARIDMLMTEVRRLDESSDIQNAFADLARRSVQSMLSLEARQLDRLVDWIDTALDNGNSLVTRVALHAQFRDELAHLLQRASHIWGVMIDDIPSAADFWLDGLVGHARGLPLEQLDLGPWPDVHARYFLRAVSASRA